MEFVAPRPGPIAKRQWWFHVQDYATSVVGFIVEIAADISNFYRRIFMAMFGIAIMLFLLLMVTSRLDILARPIYSPSTLSIHLHHWGTDEEPKAHTSFGQALDEDDTRETPIADPGETFNWPDGDVILHIVYGAETRDFRVHKSLLSFGSPVFKDMLAPPKYFLPFSSVFEAVFTVHKSSPSASDIYTVSLDDPPRAMELILRLIYPSSSPPATGDLTIVSEALDIANKYDIEVVQSRLRSSLVGFAKTEPLRVYAIAYRLGYEDEMKVASTHTLSIHFPTLIQLPDEFKLVPVTEYHRLIHLHTAYRKVVAAIAINSLSGQTFFEAFGGSQDGLPSKGCREAARAARESTRKHIVDTILKGTPLDYRRFTLALMTDYGIDVEARGIGSVIRYIINQANELNLTV